MVSQRYLDAKRMACTFWKRIIRYWLLILSFGLLIGWVVELTRSAYGLFSLVWALLSLSITYISFFLFYHPSKDMDGDL